MQNNIWKRSGEFKLWNKFNIELDDTDRVDRKIPDNTVVNPFMLMFHISRAIGIPLHSWSTIIDTPSSTSSILIFVHDQYFSPGFNTTEGN